MINPVLTFKTDKGSRYWIDKNGRSQRYKFYHLDTSVKGQGLKELYDYIIFVSNTDADIIANATTTTGKWWMIIRRKQLFIVNFISDNHLTIKGPFDIYYYPRIGLAPIEIMKMKYEENLQGYMVQKYFHIGNKIIELDILIDTEKE